MTDTKVYCWEFSFYSQEEGDDLEVTYYTYTDNSELAKRQFVEDEGPVDFTLALDEVITEDHMKDIYGLDMVLDK